MKKGIILLAIVFLIGACQKQTVIRTRKPAQGHKIKLVVTPGPAWLSPGAPQAGLSPQIAVWTETLKGRYHNTLFVTEKTGKQNWQTNQPLDPNFTHFSQSLPYWLHKRRQKWNNLPTPKRPMPDGVTAATPTQKFVLKTATTFKKLKQVFLYMEINQALDYNQNFPAKKDKIEEALIKVGQPSIIYRTKVDFTKPGLYQLQLWRHTGPEGGQQTIGADFGRFTTAPKLISKAVVVVK
jgi:hypothetical protein